MTKYTKDQSHTLEKRKKWIVVANRTDAIIYVDGANKRLRLVEHYCNKIGKLPEGALDSDKPGRGFSSAASGTIHHALDRTFTKYEQVAIRFARRIAKKLAEARGKNGFDELILVAEPHFLGLIRESLGASMRKRVVLEIPREYPARIKASVIRESVLRER